MAATRLGSYEILAKLARGGMAELFLARVRGPEGSEKLVVLKKILPEYAKLNKFVKLFLDETKLAATLDHPHIARVYDMGTVDGNYFFTMEYVHGRDVRSTLRRTALRKQKFPIAAAVQVARDIAEALHYAHERRQPDGTSLGIVHRDISPSNILLSYDGAVKLVDFGVAKAASRSVKTRTGVLKGKISYMSPEQARGATIDHRSDIYSLGIVLWEMLTTQRLFRADNDLAIIQMIIQSKPSRPSELRSEIAARLDDITTKALAADLELRYQTAEQLQLDLEDFAREAQLGSSTGALRTQMQVLFEPEITAWKEAQEAGITLTDHVMAASTVDATTPVSDSELEFATRDDEEDEPVEDDEDQPSMPTLLDGRAGTLETLAVPASADEEPTENGPPAAPGADAGTAVTVRAASVGEESFEDETALFAPKRDAAGAAVENTPAVPVPIVPVRHASSGPIVVPVTYPSLRSDPSYEAISRERKPELGAKAPRARRQPRAIAIAAGAAIAVAIGVIAALIVVGRSPHRDGRIPCADFPPQDIPVHDRARCAIAACRAHDASNASELYQLAPQSEQAAIVQACRDQGIEIAPAHPRAP